MVGSYEPELAESRRRRSGGCRTGEVMEASRGLSLRRRRRAEISADGSCQQPDFGCGTAYRGKYSVVVMVGNR
jgi:hypothetical protein